MRQRRDYGPRRLSTRSPSESRNLTFALVGTLFLVSGATGLLYEVAFSKVLATIFGATAYAISTVLSAFMAGLALGAHLGGRVSPKLSRPLLGYGIAEVAVGAVCAATPSVFDLLAHTYLEFARGHESSLGLLTAARGGLTFIVILVPTACMGATLPLLSRVVSGTKATSSGLPRLYAINTLGGALGSVASAYAILPLLGVRGTMRAAAIVNVLIGVVAMVSAMRSAAPGPAAPAEPAARNEKSSGLRDLLVFAFASGFLVFAAEVVETHLLALLIGNSAYAFGLMLAAFLVCLGIGAARSPALQRKHGEAALGRGLLYAGLALALTLPLWDQLPRFFAFAGKHVFSWAGRETCRAFAAVVVLALPTLSMGTTFPLLLAKISHRVTVAKDVGTLTVANTIGTIIGSIATGYLILPALGSERTLSCVAAAFVAFGILALFLGKAAEAGAAMRKQRVIAFGLAATTAAVLLLLPRWDLARLTNGANVYFTYGPPPDSISFVREDVHGGVTTVAKRGNLQTLYTNGKFQGDDGAEMKAQRRFAHYPSLFVPRDDRAMVIGLGTGTTLGTVAAYPFKEIDVAEISPAIVEASRLFFAGPARNSLDDPRVRMHLNDGRNLLLVTDKPYDLIAIELSSVWFSGASAMYSREFYELCKSRLSQGGILQQWVQLHHLRPRELAAIIRTLRLVFPHVALFEGGAQGILVASNEPLVASRKHLEEVEQIPAIRETMDRPHMVDIFEELLTSESDLDRFVSDQAAKDGEAPISTDDNLFLEYATPKGNILEYQSSLAASLDLLRRYRTPDVLARHLGP